MKIAIAPFASPFIDFFVNLSSYLETLGHEVHFINPDKYIRKILRKNNFQCKLYQQDVKTINYFNDNNNLIRYYKRLYSIKNSTSLVKRKNREYTQALAYFTNHSNYDKLLVWNGDGNVESIACKQLEICCMFFENGYFPNTLQLNYGGVNCKADFARLSYGEFVQYYFTKAEIKQKDIQIQSFKQNILSRYLFRLTDSSYSYLFLNILRSNRLKWLAKRRFSKIPEDQINLSSLGNYIFFPLQVNSDTQIVLNSSYNSMYEALSEILPALLETGYKIILKEHPAEVEPVNYNKFVDNENIFLLKKYSIDQLIRQATFTVNINSSVGLQAVAENSKVLVLGESLYAQAPNVIQYIKGDNISALLTQMNFDPSAVEKYIQHLKKDIFIKGNWRSPDLELLHKASERILG